MCEECLSANADEKRSAEYGRNVRGAARALWSGAVDFDQFFDILSSTIRVGLTRNWYAGAAECGITPNDLSPEERVALQQAIFSETSRISGFAQFIEQNDKESGAKLGAVLARASLWSSRANDIQNKARVMACGDQKLMWNLGATKEHCPTCATLDKKVKRASFWARSGLHPQDPPNASLKCGGWQCDCTLDVTDAPLSRGPLPRR